jgi:hypothetical protein
MGNLTKKQATDILSRLGAGGTLSNVDFENMGFGFEAFLKYGQLRREFADKFHERISPRLKEIAA